MGDAARSQAPTLSWVYVGQGSMGAAAFVSVMERRGDVPAPRAVLSAEPPWGVRPVAAAAEARDCPVHHVSAVGEDPVGQWPDVFADLDVAVVGCWTERIRRQALDLPREGWWNLHPSALPAWRGLDPVGWQLATGARELGCTVHRITEGQDDGNILAQGAVTVEPGDDREAVLVRAGARLGELAAHALARLASGASVDDRPQDPRAATWCPPGGVVAMLDPRQLRAAAGARVARAFSPQPGVALANMAGEQRFAVVEMGHELDVADVPGAIEGIDGYDGVNVSVAFRDRWVRGRTWMVDADRPSVTSLGPLELSGEGADPSDGPPSAAPQG